MKVTFELPPGVNLPRFIDCTLPQQLLAVLEGKATYRPIIMSNGCILKVVVPNEVPEFTVKVVEPRQGPGYESCGPHCDCE